MPDKWEYPWYAAWDLAFHMLPLSMVDPDFAKQQLDLMLRNDYLHPNGQLPAYEWNFGDVNPPVHAWATFQIYQMDKERDGGKGDIQFLKYAFSQAAGQFHLVGQPQGPRRRATSSKAASSGWTISASSTAAHRCPPAATWSRPTVPRGWRSTASNMLRIARRTGAARAAVRGIRGQILRALRCSSPARSTALGDRHDEMWDEEDGFFYDVLRLPDGRATRLKVRSIVGLLPLASMAVFEEDILDRLPRFRERAQAFGRRHPELIASMHMPAQPGVANRRMLAVVDERKLRRILARMLDEEEFFGPHGIRALSRHHLEHPYVFQHAGQDYRVAYVPGDSDSGHVRRQLQLARPGVDAGQLPALYRAAAPLRLLRRGFQGRMSHRLGPADDAAGRGQGTGRAAGAHFPAATNPAHGRPWRQRTPSRTTRTGASCCCSTNTSTATAAPASAPATRPAGPAAWRASSRPMRC